MSFVHLHTHSHYSLLDSTNKIPNLVNKIKELKQEALALTDHGNMFGMIEFYRECEKNNIKPIIGCEVYIAYKSHLEKNHYPNKKRAAHLVLLAMNEIGYKNLIKLVSLGYDEGFYFSPRVDKKQLQEYNEGLIASSACLAGEIPMALTAGDYKQALELTKEYSEIFSNDRFFLEVQNHELKDQQIVNEGMIKLHKETNIPIIATNDAHYINKEDSVSHDILLCIGTNSKLSDENRKRYDGNQFYVKSEEEMLEAFPNLPEAITNTAYVAEKCNVKLEFGKFHLPDFDVPENHSLSSYLKELCEDGLKKRYEDIDDELKNRLNFELETINKMQLNGYFLITWEFVNWCREKSIIVGPGRGSAAGSLVSYTLGITDVDPIKYNLFFERFLNPYRISMPDIDTDIEDTRRDEVIEHVKEIYGHDTVSGIITFGTLGAKQAVRDVCRVMDIPIKTADEIAKMISGAPGTTLTKAFKDNQEIRNKIGSDDNLTIMWQHALNLEGLCRHASKHAAGILIGNKPLSEIVPMYKDSGTGDLVSQFDGRVIEDCGLLKMDFLGLKNLTVINASVKLIKENHDIDIDIDNISLEDVKTYKLLQSGKTNGCFQLVSKGMQDLMVRLKPDRFEDIIVLISLYRPGPIKFADEYIQRKHGRKPIVFPHPTLEKVLKDTYGIIVYQEHVMQIVQVIAGFDLGEADTVRKAMGKKKKDIMSEMKIKFFKGGKEKEVPEQTLTELWDAMAEFAGYGFNKAHATPYGLLAYQTAYLKSNYPVEYMTALMTVFQYKTDDLVKYINDFKDLGGTILQPDVNESLVDFSTEEDKIRFGLQAIKNVGYTVAKDIIEERQANGKYKDIYDLTQRVKSINKRALESLVKAGAFTSTNDFRKDCYQIVEEALDYGLARQREANSSQISLFSEDTPSIKMTPQVIKQEEWDQLVLLQYEKEALGLFLSNHPMKKYEELFDELNLITIDETKQEYVNFERIFVAAILSKLSIRTTKKTKELYANVIIEDMSANNTVMIFPKLYNEIKEKLEEDKIYLWLIRCDNKEGSNQFIEDVIDIEEIDKAKIKRRQRVYLKKADDCQKSDDSDIENNNKSENKDIEKTNNNNINNNTSKGGNSMKNGVMDSSNYIKNEKHAKEEMIPAAKMDNKYVERNDLHIELKDQELNVAFLENIKNYLGNEKGISDVIFHLQSNEGKNILVKAGSSFKVNPDKELMDRLRQIPIVKDVYVA